MTMRALTRLNQAGVTVQASQQHVRGMLDEMPLNRILRDPQNPRPPLDQRTTEEQQKQRELNANIKKRGVKSPISLRPHPTIPDMWIINHGHCRYDGAEAAELATIPYFIDPNFDSYDQIAENLHRADLSPWSVAEFIKRKLEQKQTKGQIAEGIGKESESYISEHIALIDAPRCLHLAYANKVRSTRTLYDLRRAYDEFPEQVELWCESGTKITRPAIQELLRHLQKRPEQQNVEIPTEFSQELPASEFRHDEKTLPSNFDAAKAQQDEAGADDAPQLPAATGTVKFGASTSANRPAAVASQFRHDEKKPPESGQKTLPLERSNNRSTTGEIPVQYRGKVAMIVPNTKVKIVLAGRDDPLEVQLTELVFK